MLALTCHSSLATVDGMFSPTEYQLLDFGDGRKLERFGGYILDRPSPAAENITPARRELWREAAARFVRVSGDRGQWQGAENLPPRWVVSHRQIRLELKLTEFGHVGVFPEQADDWDWLTEQVHAVGPLKVLNLFAYTGASTLAVAAAGARAVHVDAAANTVTWARRNARLSGLADAPVRWITEDATRFVRRELKRGNYYDAVILDPPSYGHGPRGQVWRLANDLGELLSRCAELTARTRRFMLLTCHSPGIDPSHARQLLSDAIGRPPEEVVAQRLTIESLSGQQLDCGVLARWPA